MRAKFKKGDKVVINATWLCTHGMRGSIVSGPVGKYSAELGETCRVYQVLAQITRRFVRNNITERGAIKSGVALLTVPESVLEADVGQKTATHPVDNFPYGEILIEYIRDIRPAVVVPGVTDV